MKGKLDPIYSLTPSQKNEHPLVFCFCFFAFEEMGGLAVGMFVLPSFTLYTPTLKKK